MGMIQALSQCNLHRAVGILLKQSHMQQAECLCRSGGTVDVGRIMFEFSAGTDHLFFFCNCEHKMSVVLDAEWLSEVQRMIKLTVRIIWRFVSH